MPEIKRPKLIVVGHARHGKDTVCEELQKFGYKFLSSSWACGFIVVWPKMKDRYPDYQACFDDRHNHREFWFKSIEAYNTPDLTRLAREIFSQADIYCGMRRFQELSACKAQKVCDFVIWVDSFGRGIPHEDSSSMTVKEFQADHVLQNSRDLDYLKEKVEKFYWGFLKPWEDRLANPEPALPNRATSVIP